MTKVNKGKKLGFFFFFFFKGTVFCLSRTKQCQTTPSRALAALCFWNSHLLFYWFFLLVYTFSVSGTQKGLAEEQGLFLWRHEPVKKTKKQFFFDQTMKFLKGFPQKFLFPKMFSWVQFQTSASAFNSYFLWHVWAS